MHAGPIAIAGGGRVGQALGRLLHERGEPVAAVACRTREHALAAAAFIGPSVAAASYSELPSLASRILIPVPDDAIREVARLIADGGMRSGLALHTSGAAGVDVLQPLADQGVSCGSLHPLQTIPSPEKGLTALRGISFAVDGVGAAAAWAEQIARSLEGRTFRIDPELRTLYHAAAVMASNYVVALIGAAAELMEQSGVPQREALAALAPLVEASARNALTIGPEKALTGPIRRGDRKTVASHLSALRQAPPTIEQLYRAAGRQTLRVAGLDENCARELENLLVKARQ